MKKPPLNRIASGAASAVLEEGREVAGDGGIGDVGQAEFAEEAALLFLGLVVEVAEGEEAFEREFERFFAQDLGLERAADQAGSAAEHRDLDLFEFGSASRRSLAAAHWRRRPLRWRSES